jgi:tRNA-specific 2-thiouridylase
MVKAIGLLSGGLDSTLAVKMMIDQGIVVLALNFTSPFCTCTKQGCTHEATRVAKELGVKIKVLSKGEDYLKVVRNPRHGYGKNMNPCIDCRIFIFRKAKEYMEETGASFIFTGEVLGQRPMSQRMGTLNLIEKESGLAGLVLRPLSAKFMNPTIPEIDGVVNRERLMGIQGRGRKPQIQLAEELEIKDYMCPAGGCLLTSQEFARKLRDLFEHKTRVSQNDVQLLKIGRHFRFGRNKIIVGRNESENNALMTRKQKTDYIFEVTGCGSPYTLLQGRKTKDAIRLAAGLTGRYSDCQEEKVHVKYGKIKPTRSIIVERLTQADIDKLKSLVNLVAA